MTKMIINDEVLDKMDRGRLFELMIFHGLPISQAIAVHLCDDLQWRPCDAGRLVGLSNIAISDARAKGRVKLNKN